MQTVGQFCYDQRGDGWWLPWRRTDDPYANDQNDWIAPIKVASSAFNQFASRLTSSPIIGKAAKEIQEACVGEAYKGNAIHAIDWSSYDYPTRTLRIAISHAHVVKISPDGYDVERNGVGTVYTLPPDFEELSLPDVLSYMRPGAEFMPNFHACFLDDIPAARLANFLDDTPAWTTKEQAAIVKAWWLGMFLESAVPGRPILSFIGEKGSGKSVSARQLGILYYGKNFEVAGGVGGSRAVKDMIATSVSVPVTVADDLNDVPADIVDTLCKISTGAKIRLATMHETLALSSYNARSSIALTSNRPAWALRDDLMDRMLPLVLISGTASSSPGLTEVARNYRSSTHRAAVWGETLYSLYFALAYDYSWPKCVRFEEWESLVRRIAHFGEWHTDLHSALCKTNAQRVAVSCWADPFAHALYAVAATKRDEQKFYTTSELYDAIVLRYGGTVSAVETDRPSARAASSPTALGKFLSKIHGSGSTVVHCLRGPDIGGKATWTLTPKGE
jgi:hypothetical protein